MELLVKPNIFLQSDTLLIKKLIHTGRRSDFKSGKIRSVRFFQLGLTECHFHVQLFHAVKRSFLVETYSVDNINKHAQNEILCAQCTLSVCDVYVMCTDRFN